MFTPAGRIGLFFVLGLVAWVPSCSSDGDSDDPGSGGTQEPATPQNVGMFPSSTGPPVFEIHWVVPNDTVPIASFKIYESDKEFDDPSEAAVIAASPGTFRAAEVEVKPGTGVRHFRVSAVSTGSVEGALSAELAIDTTSRLFFIADRITNDVVEAFSTPAIVGAEPLKLSGALVAGGNVERMFPSPD